MNSGWGENQPLIFELLGVNMTIDTILELAGIPLLVFAVCVYYGIRLMITQNAGLIRGRDKAPLKDEKNYAKEAGKLILFFGIATLIMGILILFNTYAAVGEIAVCTLIMGVLWKRMNDQYGA